MSVNAVQLNTTDRSLFPGEFNVKVKISIKKFSLTHMNVKKIKGRKNSMCSVLATTEITVPSRTSF